MRHDTRLLRCTRCGETKPASEFYRDRRNTGRRTQCKACMKTYSRERFEKNPHLHQRHLKQQRRAAWRREYGLSESLYEALVQAQGGRCAGCGTAPETVFCVDHCHSTGRVRGLLCDSCNVALGRVNDDPAILRRLAAYLDKPPAAALLEQYAARMRNAGRITAIRSAEQLDLKLDK